MSKLIIRKNFEDLYAKDFVFRFENENLKKYILGRNEFSESMVSKFNIDGIIDDFTEDDTYLGVPIIKISDVTPNSLVVVVVVVVGKPLIAEKQVSKFQFEYLDYYSFLKYTSFELKALHFVNGSKDDILKNKKIYNDIYNKLADNESKNQMYNILNFRNSYDIRFMRGFDYIPEKQYFESFLKLSDNEVFVDAGSFDGSSSILFINNVVNYNEVYVFEPQENQMKIIKNKLHNYKNIFFYNYGIYDKDDTLSFKIDGSASSLSLNGDLKVKVIALDNISNLKPTYIKMDIEGAEIPAIDGAKNKILKYHPKLAICVYHKKDDIYKVYNKIMNIRDDYDVYFRHYTQGIYESVMYFIPKD